MAIGSIATKIDIVLMNLEKTNFRKEKRKAAISRILGTINENIGGRYCYLNHLKHTIINPVLAGDME